MLSGAMLPGATLRASHSAFAGRAAESMIRRSRPSAVMGWAGLFLSIFGRAILRFITVVLVAVLLTSSLRVAICRAAVRGVLHAETRVHRSAATTGKITPASPWNAWPVLPSRLAAHVHGPLGVFRKATALAVANAPVRDPPGVAPCWFQSFAGHSACCRPPPLRGRPIARPAQRIRPMP
jgi:hypothetical protein